MTRQEKINMINELIAEAGSYEQIIDEIFKYTEIDASDVETLSDDELGTILDCLIDNISGEM